MQKKWMGTAVSVALVASLALSGCSKGSSDNGAQASPDGQASAKPGEKVNLRFSWWGSDTRHKATLAALDKYMQLNPNVKIDAEYGGFDGYEEKLKTQLAGGSAPDLIQVDQPWLFDLSQQGDVFADLGSMKDTVDLSQFDPKFLADYATVKNKTIGLPAGLNGLILYYNKDFFKKYGIPEDTKFNWDNILEIGKKVKEQSGGKNLLWNVDPNLYGEVFKFIVRQKTGEQFIKDDYTLGFGKAEAVQAMQYLKEYIDAGVTPPFEESSAYDKKVEQNPRWFKGEYGFTVNWASNIPVMKKDVPFQTGVTATMIAPDYKGTTAVVTRPSQVLAVNNKSKNIKESAKLLNWLLNDKEAVSILGDVRGTPASQSGLKALTDAGKMDPEIAKATDIALKTSGGPESGLTNNAEIIKARLDVIQKLAYKKSTPEQAADEMISVLNAKLKELKASK